MPPASSTKWPVLTTKVRKYFESENDWFHGHVASFDAAAQLYTIHYDDGDIEEMDAAEMNECVVVVVVVTDAKGVVVTDAKKEAEGTTPRESSSSPSAVNEPLEEPQTTRSLRGRKRTVVSYVELDGEDDVFDDDDDNDDEEEVLPTKKSRRSTSKASTRQKAKKTKDDDDDDDDEVFSDVAGFESEESEDLMEVDDEEESEDEELLEEEKPKRVKSSSSKKQPKKKAAATTAKKEKVEGKQSMAEAFKPFNTPLYWKMPLKTIKEEYEYLDPCGMEATDDIIDHLVGEQVLKIGSLLQRALESKNNKSILGTKENPLNFGTVCSGTDAPALALTMVAEQMERFGVKAKLHVNHKFSCEKEPFKQSYLARNFDSTLYPDVVKLTESDAPHDVFGRPTPVPDFNVLIAGTSCKNFSMLHSTKRLDIEDKGCSGETFLATVELIMKNTPVWFILENVQGAPWKKMEEYISGRVPLATINDKSKAIQKTVQKDLKIKELKFELQKNTDNGKDAIVAVEVPMQAGVRCGAIVKGFLKQGTRTVIPAKWPKKGQKTCTLNELLKVVKDKVNEKTDILMFDMPCTYCTAIGKVDTKKYGLPQTRSRTYMFVWQPEDPENYDDDRGEYWQALLKFLESPVKHSLEAFILEENHDNIRVFREALHGPPGRHTKRSVFQEPDFFTSGNANVKHNKIAREKLGIEMMARPNFGGGARGKKQIPPHYWLEYADTMEQRITDMLDILHVSAARDAETHDSNFASFFWNLSQNVSKEKHRGSIPGIAGCISPGGELFCPHLGRPLLGCEKLLLQGIPYFRLALGSESEVELGDMAGNAMSLTVVGAAQLAALIAPKLQEECPNIDDLPEYLATKCGLPRETSIVTPTRAPTFQSLSDACAQFSKLAELAPEAVASSVWCTCETSGRNSSSDTFMACSTCRISCCSSCLGSHNGYQMASHAVEEKRMAGDEHHMGHFQSKLRNVAPSSLVFDEQGIELLAGLNCDVHRVKDLWKFVFNLQDIKRKRRKWVIHYNARDNDGVGEVVAEFRITVGELWTQVQGEGNSPQLGMTGELISYFPAKMPPLVREKLECCALVTVHSDAPEQVLWRSRDTMKSFQLKIVGSDPAPSTRVELGLTDTAGKALRVVGSQGAQKSYFKLAKERGEEERWLYHKNWKDWPNTMTMHSDDLDEINGDYKRAACRQTTNQSALWIKHGNKDRPALYLIIKPNVGRTGPDTAIISRSISHEDFGAILVSIPSWQPSHALDSSKHSMDAEKSVWLATEQIKCSVPESSVSVVTEKSVPSFLTVKGLTPTQVTMLYPFPTSSDNIPLNVHSGTEAQKINRAFNYLCVPPIMRHAARDTKLSHELSPEAQWTTLSTEAGTPFGCCTDTIPPRPVETWYFDEDRRVWARRSNPEDSRAYYTNLQNAPKSWQFNLDRSKRELSIGCYPKVAGHHAAKFLLEGRGNTEKAAKNMVVSYRLSDTSLQSDPEYSPFKVYKCDEEEKTDVLLKSPFALYERQQKVVTKMSMIEQGNIDFEELEMSEHEMPGSAGYSVIAKASRNRKISGGVIADAIGAGKTVISIAMMVQGLEAARASRSSPRQSGATAVVVPSALVGQWESEIKKFSSELKTLCIHDTKSLEKVSVRQIIEADVVIFPVDIIEGKGYIANLVEKSGVKTIPPLSKSMGQMEQAGAKGVWIPATSQDPFGRGSANEMKVSHRNHLHTFGWIVDVSNNRSSGFYDSIESKTPRRVCLLHSFIS
jgi:site-specific DNA-cytosine methylase